MKTRVLAVVCCGCMTLAKAHTQLGIYFFNDAQFGNAVHQSDNGAFARENWINISDTDPGVPGFLTGAGFETGVANIGIGPPVTYTIEYSNPILNIPGADLGIVVARFSPQTADVIRFWVSTDGTSFTSPMVIPPGSAVSSGVNRSYYYQGAGPYEATLYVHPVDLSDLGIAAGSGIVAVRITGEPQLDLIRVAGLVPEPSSLALLTVGGFLVFLRNRRRAV